MQVYHVKWSSGHRLSTESSQTLEMACTEVFKMFVTFTNHSSFQEYSHMDNKITQSKDSSAASVND